MQTSVPECIRENFVKIRLVANFSRFVRGHDLSQNVSIKRNNAVDYRIDFNQPSQFISSNSSI